MQNNYFFELPVYSMKKEVYEIKIEDYIQKKIKTFNIDKNSLDYKLFYETYRKTYYDEWQFNQIIGYLKLYRLGNSIYADYWKIDKQRIPLILRNKTFKYLMGSAVKWNIDLNELKTSTEIFKRLMEILPKDSSEYLIKGKYLDTSILEKTGQFIDWINLLEKYK